MGGNLGVTFNMKRCARIVMQKNLKYLQIRSKMISIFEIKNAMEISNAFLGVITFLLGIVTYFAKLGVSEVKEMRKEMSEHKSGIDKLEVKVENIDKRVTKLEC